jgi:hypothetical protein
LKNHVKAFGTFGISRNISLAIFSYMSSLAAFLPIPEYLVQNRYCKTKSCQENSSQGSLDFTAIQVFTYRPIYPLPK